MWTTVDAAIKGDASVRAVTRLLMVLAVIYLDVFYFVSCHLKSISNDHLTRRISSQNNSIHVIVAEPLQ